MREGGGRKKYFLSDYISQCYINIEIFIKVCMIDVYFDQKTYQSAVVSRHYSGKKKEREKNTRNFLSIFIFNSLRSTNSSTADGFVCATAKFQKTDFFFLFIFTQKGTLWALRKIVSTA